MKYDREVKAAAAHWGRVYGVTLEPALIHAVIERESTHGRRLTAAEPNGTTSYGPMMVNGPTARDLGLDDPLEMVRTPGLGVWFGVKYLGKMVRLFPGDVARAVAAYNAGPGNTTRNRAGKFINQPYVDFVLRHWKLYRGAVLTLPAAAIGGMLILYAVTRARRRRAA